MRIFFIVAAAVLFVHWMESGYRYWSKVLIRANFKALGAPEGEYTEKRLKKHPALYVGAVIPILGFVVLVVGFLWAIFWN